MNKLIEKIRMAREQKVEAGGFTFIVRRPTAVEMIELSGEGSIARLLPFVVGWDGIKEIDIIAGGDPHPLAFDADVCSAWLSDRSDLLDILITAIIDAYAKHRAAQAEKLKN